MLLMRTSPSRLMWTALIAIAILAAAFVVATGLDSVRTNGGGREGTVRSMPLMGSARSFTPPIDVLEARATQQIDDASIHRDLGIAYLQKARETADPIYYTRADAALTKAQALDANDPNIQVALGMLALARHQFAEALVFGERAKALNPRMAAAYGVIGDAQVELGRYDDALVTVQRMVDLRPDLASYARVSYIRELHGDLPGAIEAMRLAAQIGATAGEHGSWTRVQLGYLLLRTGAIDEATREYQWALAASPGDMLAVAGLGRARLTVGDYEGAIPFYEQAAERMPLPELVLTLGDLYEATGRSDEADRQFGLARVLQQLVEANGGSIDLELALFEAERGDPLKAVALAQAEVGRRPSIHAYDALAWALYHTEDYLAAREASQQALRLGTDDALMLFHAGMIDLALTDYTPAREKLTRALATDPGFSARHAPTARRLLAQLEVGGPEGR